MDSSPVRKRTSDDNLIMGIHRLICKNIGESPKK